VGAKNADSRAAAGSGGQVADSGQATETTSAVSSVPAARMAHAAERRCSPKVSRFLATNGRSPTAPSPMGSRPSGPPAAHTTGSPAASTGSSRAVTVRVIRSPARASTGSSDRGPISAAAESRPASLAAESAVSSGRATGVSAPSDLATTPAPPTEVHHRAR
jgi:hypothetical protein